MYLKDVEFRDVAAKEIALTFEVPRTTASSWKRNIGDIGLIEQTLGENAPEGYLDLIQRREWIPVEIKEKEDEWIFPMKKWCVANADEVYLVHKSEREEFYDEKDKVGSRSMGLGSGWRAVEFSSGFAVLNGRRRQYRFSDIHYSGAGYTLSPHSEIARFTHSRWSRCSNHHLIAIQREDQSGRRRCL